MKPNNNSITKIIKKVKREIQDPTLQKFLNNYHKNKNILRTLFKKKTVNIFTILDRSFCFRNTKFYALPDVSKQDSETLQKMLIKQIERVMYETNCSYNFYNVVLTNANVYHRDFFDILLLYNEDINNSFIVKLNDVAKYYNYNYTKTQKLIAEIQNIYVIVKNIKQAKETFSGKLIESANITTNKKDKYINITLNSNFVKFILSNTNIFYVNNKEKILNTILMLPVTLRIIARFMLTHSNVKISIDKLIYLLYNQQSDNTLYKKQYKNKLIKQIKKHATQLNSLNIFYDQSKQILHYKKLESIFINNIKILSHDYQYVNDIIKSHIKNKKSKKSKKP